MSIRLSEWSFTVFLIHSNMLLMPKQFWLIDWNLPSELAIISWSAGIVSSSSSLSDVVAKQNQSRMKINSSSLTFMAKQWNETLRSGEPAIYDWWLLGPSSNIVRAYDRGHLFRVLVVMHICTPSCLTSLVLQSYNNIEKGDDAYYYDTFKNAFISFEK